MTTIIVAAIGFAGVIGAAWLQNRKTRLMNTHEHNVGAKEREVALEATLLAIGFVHEDVKAVRCDLQAHIVDHGVHSQNVVVVNPPQP